MRDKRIQRMTFSAMFLALCLVLPFLILQIPRIGQALSPMHIPVLICGFVCGPAWGAGVGAVAPLLRSVLFGMPAPLYPGALGMAFEMAAYGFMTGWLYRLLPKKQPSVYAALLGSMLFGRLVWGIVSFLLYGLQGTPFTLDAFLGGAFVNAVPGIICHVLLIPPIVMALRRAGLICDE